MIIDALISIVQAILSPLFAALPTNSLGFFGDVQTFATSVGHSLGPWNGMLPVVDLANVVLVLCTVWLPALLVYVMASWVWRHIPDIGGFGPGAG